MDQSEAVQETETMVMDLPMVYHRHVTITVDGSLMVTCMGTNIMITETVTMTTGIRGIGLIVTMTTGMRVIGMVMIEMDIAVIIEEVVN